jgi:hypothetical protein
LVKDTTSEKDDNKYYEWAYIGGKWEKIGEIHEDITGYLKKSQSADDVNKGPILSEGTLSYCIGNEITYKVPLFDNSTDNVFGKGSGYLPLTSQRVVVGNGYYLGSGDSYTSSGITIAGGSSYFKPKELKFTDGNVLNTTGLYLYCYGDGKTQFSYDGIELSSYSTKINMSVILGNNQPCGITWASSDYKTTYARLIHGEITKTAGLLLQLPQYTAKDYSDDKTNPNFTDALLDLNKYCAIFSSGIYLKDKTRNDLLNGGGFTTNIGSTDDTTIYHNVAPLIQDTEDETKWYIPAKYMNWDVQIDGESIVDTDTQIANIDYLKKGDQILIKADTDTLHAIVTSGKVDLGDSNTASANKQVAIGFNNTIASTALRSYIFGNENTNNSADSVVIGGSNTSSYSGASSDNNYIIGCSNTNAGRWNTIIGSANDINAKTYSSLALGKNNATTNSSTSVNYSYMIGYNNSTSAGSSTIIGIENANETTTKSYIFGFSNTITSSSATTIDDTTDDVAATARTVSEQIVLGENNTVTSCTYFAVCGNHNEISDANSIDVYGSYNIIKGTKPSNNVAVVGRNNTITISNGLMYSTCIGFNNTINLPTNAVVLGNNLTVTNATEIALGYINNSTSGSTIFSVGNGCYNGTSKTTTRHNLIEANQDGDLYIVEKTNTDGDTTNYYERPMKRLQTWLNEKVDVANIGADDDTTAYTHVCPIVQDAVDTSKWTIPSRYLDATIQDAAYKSEENTFSKTNTFTDGTGNDVIVAANQITVQSETNATMINSSGIINGTKTPKDLFNAAGDYTHIGTSADTADYTNVAPIKETSETYTPAGGTETTETNTIVPMDYMPKQLHVEDKVDEKSTQVVSSKAIYEAIPHIYIHDVVISHGSNTNFYSYLQIYTLDDYDFSTVANIAKWMNNNGYKDSITGHPCVGRTNSTSCNMFCWYSANGTTLTLLYTTGNNISAYNCDSLIKISVRKKKLFNE